MPTQQADHKIGQLSIAFEMLSPCKRKELIRQLRKLGFSGPLVGGNHQYMVQGKLKIWIPNPHQGDISKSLLAKILQQANISREEWEKLR